MRRLESRFFRALLFGQASAFFCLVYLIFLDAGSAGRDARGLVARFMLAFYVPAALAVHLCAAVCLIASALYLKSPSNSRNAWARASAECACVFGAIVVICGALWTNQRLGAHWTWYDNRPLKLLLTALLFGAIVVFRRFAGDGDSERKFAAALGVLGVINVPLIRHAVELWMPSHSSTLPAIRVTNWDPNQHLALGCVAMAFLTALLVWSRARLALSADRLAEIEQSAAAAELLDT